MAHRSQYLLPGESIVLQTHQHALILFPSLLVNAVSLAVLAWAGYAMGTYWILCFYALPFLHLAWKALLRYRKVYIVTDRRVVRQEGILAISSFDASLDVINNIQYEQGLAGRLFRYGDVTLETASEQGRIRFDFIPHPQQFKNTVLGQRDMYRRPEKQPAGESIPKLIEELASLRDRRIITPEEFEAKKKQLLSQM